MCFTGSILLYMSSEKSHISRSCALWGGSKDPPLVTMVFFLTSLWQMVLGHPTGGAAIAGHSHTGVVVFSCWAWKFNVSLNMRWLFCRERANRGKLFMLAYGSQNQAGNCNSTANQLSFKDLFCSTSNQVDKTVGKPLVMIRLSAEWQTSRGQMLDCSSLCVYALLNFTKPPQRCTKRFSALLFRHCYASLWTAIYCHMQQSSA